MAFQAVPLKHSFMILSIFGFLISVFYIDNILGVSWAVAFASVFFMMFVSSIVSMINAPVQDYDKPENRVKPSHK
jgi:hypothetical protein